MLLQIETPGRFTYDVEKNVARWDVAPQVEPHVLNDVQVNRVPPKGRGAATTLFSQVLEVEFTGAPTAGPQAPPPPGKQPEPAGGSFKRLHAWVTAPDRFVSIASEEDRLYAYGQDLTHEQEKETTGGGLMPATLDPSLAGFTKSGSPSFAMMSCARDAKSSPRTTVSNGGVGMPVCCHTSLVRSLSMPSAEPSTPLPV